MKEEAARRLIKKKLITDFGSIRLAAIHFDRTHQALDNALAGKQKGIPAYLLNHAGIKTEINYVQKGDKHHDIRCTTISNIWADS